MTRQRSRRGVVAALLGLSVVALSGQTVFRSETRLVVLHVTVTNSHGELVRNLPQQAFTVFENGKRQPISIFRSDDVPVSVGLLIDNSGSMRPLRVKVEAAALAFARASNPEDEMFVVNFADTARLDVPMTSDLQVLESGIARVDSIGGTALRDAVSTGENYLRQYAKRDARVLLVITDGNDNASATTVALVRQQAERAETVIDAIGLFSGQQSSSAGAGRHELEALTDETGGVAYFPASVEQVESVAVDLARQIRNQYTIAYAPLNQTLDGSYRTIRVSVNGPEHYKVRTRAGYRASPDAPR
jgi:Ca-activated chloride channel family protein